MIWDGWLDFMAMDGYALYVWGSYVVALALVATELTLLPLRERTIFGYLGCGRGELELAENPGRGARDA